jgi:hypothetical protein
MDPQHSHETIRHLWGSSAMYVEPLASSQGMKIAAMV